MKRLSALLLGFTLLLAGGCKPGMKGRGLTPLQRKQAASLASEADFALTLNDLPRATGLYKKAAELCPDLPIYQESLGMAQRKAGNLKEAGAAYREALALHEELYRQNKNPGDLLQEAWLLALLGRDEEAVKLLQKARVSHPDDPRVRQTADPKWLESVHRNPAFKAMAL